MYCLVYGQMSHWGIENLTSKILCFIQSFAWNVNNIYIIIIILYLNKISTFGDYIIEDSFDKFKKIINKCEKRSEVTNFNKPLNDDILSIIYGSLLGDASAEKRKGGKGTRILFYQESSHDNYLLYLHNLVASLGYCNTKIPKITTRLGNKGKIRKIIRFSTWTYDNFNYIHNEWYNNGIKIVPKSLDKYFTPLALAIWIMDDGCKLGKGLKLATNSFSYDDNLYLVNLLLNKYNIKSTIHKTGTDNQYNIYIWTESMPTLVNLVKPYIIPSMKYKFGNFI